MRRGVAPPARGGGGWRRAGTSETSFRSLAVVGQKGSPARRRALVTHIFQNYNAMQLTPALPAVARAARPQVTPRESRPAPCNSAQKALPPRSLSATPRHGEALSMGPAGSAPASRSRAVRLHATPRGAWLLSFVFTIQLCTLLGVEFRASRVRMRLAEPRCVRRRQARLTYRRPRPGPPGQATMRRLLWRCWTISLKYVRRRFGCTQCATDRFLYTHKMRRERTPPC